MRDEQHVIVVGGDRIGLQTARIVADRGDGVTVVEHDGSDGEDSPTGEASVGPTGELLVVGGDAVRSKTLERAGVGTADTVAALTDDAELNVAVCATAAEVAPDVRTVARIRRPIDETRTAVVDRTVLPGYVGARAAATELLDAERRSTVDPPVTLDVVLDAWGHRSGWTPWSGRRAAKDS
jgi:trk system potassium uptake protein TrkA